MAQWGRSDEAAANGEVSQGAPIGVGAAVKWDKLNRVDSANAHSKFTTVAGSRANTDYNLFNNDSTNAFINNMAVGVFGVSANAMANNTDQGVPDQPAHAGWVLRRAGTGGIATATIAAGTNFVNGETVIVSNGSSNGLLTLTTNAAGVPTPGGVTVTTAGCGWANNSMAKKTFVREKHLSTVTFSAGAGAVGYSNSDIITFSNATSAYVNGYTANLSTNATGGTVTTTVAEKGRFANDVVITDLVATVTKYDGTTAVGNTTLSAMTGAVATSSGGTITITLGGRAGRVHTETLVAMGSLGVSNSTLYGPNSAVFVNSTAVNSSHYIDPA